MKLLLILAGRRTASAAVALVLVIAGGVLIASALGANQVPTVAPTINSRGLWTLARLGYQQQRLPVDQPVNLVRLDFQLPRGVAAAARRCYERTGRTKKTCFLLHYHFRIRFEPTTPSGFIYVSAATNRFTSSQVPFEVTVPEGQLTIRWSTLDLIRGYDPFVTHDPEIEVRNVNYLQTRGLRDGANTLDYQLEISRGVLVSSVEVLPDSGLEWTSVPPGKLSLAVKPRSLLSRVNKIVRIAFEVKRTSGRPPENVKIRSQFDPSMLGPLGAAEQVAPIVRGSFRGRFLFHVLRPGKTRIGLNLISGTTRQATVVRLRAQ